MPAHPKGCDCFYCWMDHLHTADCECHLCYSELKYNRYQKGLMMEKTETGNTSTNPKVAVERLELGCLLHTNLRKNCDDDVTSLAYNIIGLCQEGWHEYVELVWEELQEEADLSAVDALVRAVEQLPYGSFERNALNLIFAQFPGTAFVAMSSHVFHPEPKEVKKCE